MPKIKLITNVSEYGVLRGLATTRRRLVLATVATTGATYGFGLLSTHFILHQSRSVVLNLGLMTAVMMVLLVASYLQACLAGDLTFSGAWREQVLLGKQRRDDADDLEGVSVEDHNAEFIILVVAAMAVNAFALNAIAGNFFVDYQNTGFFQVELRSKDPSDRKEALVHMADPMNFELWNSDKLQSMVIGAMKDPAAPVRAQAAWDAGVMKLDVARPALISLVRHGTDDQARSEAAVALGKLGEDAQARASIAGVLAQTKDPKLQVGMLKGLGLMRSSKSIPAIAPFTKSSNKQVMAYAFWALQRTHDHRARPVVRAALDHGARGLEKCAALDALKQVATEKDVLWARRQFQLEKPKAGCKPLTWQDHDAIKYIIVRNDSFRLKLMKIVANVDPFPYKAWFQRLVNDPEQPWQVRKVADAILTQMKKAEAHGALHR